MFSSEGFATCQDLPADAAHEEDAAELKEPDIEWVEPLIPRWSIWRTDMEQAANNPEDDGRNEDEIASDRNGQTMAEQMPDSSRKSEKSRKNLDFGSGGCLGAISL